MKKIAGLDIGNIKIGVSLMDSEVKIAFPHRIIYRTGIKIEQEIADFIKNEGISELVVGLPLSEDGSENQQCKKVRSFVRRLQARIHIPIVFFDEYGTSFEARELSKSSKKDEDAEAAALMLQRYADSKLS